MREAVKDYMHDLLNMMALKDVYSRDGDTFGYPEARATVDKLFSTLEERYGKRDKQLPINNAK